jgi:hypothetical protein
MAPEWLTPFNSIYWLTVFNSIMLFSYVFIMYFNHIHPQYFLHSPKPPAGSSHQIVSLLKSCHVFIATIINIAVNIILGLYSANEWKIHYFPFLLDLCYKAW